MTTNTTDTTTATAAAELDTTPPHDPDAERSVLGALMWKPQLLDDIHLTGPDFYDPRHETIWHAINHLATTGQPIDPITIGAHLTQTGDLDRIGGPIALADLYSAADIPDHAPIHARIIRDRAIQRATLTATTRIRQQALTTTNPDQLLTDAQNLLANILNTRPDTTPTTTAAQAINDLANRIGTEDLTGDPTPWPALNELIGGLQPGRLYTIGARPGVGKSLTAQSLAEHTAAIHQKGVYFATCEMPAREIGMRMLARNTGIPISQLKKGEYLTTKDWDTINEQLPKLQETHGRLAIADAPGQTVASIRTGAKQHARTTPLGLIVADYLQLLRPPPGPRNRNREREVAENSMALKELAMELNVPVVMLSQLNRAAAGRTDKRPTLTDLRESGAVENDSDAVILLHQPEPEEDPTRLDVYVEKNRDGTKGQCRLRQQGWIANITDDRQAIR